MKKFDANSAAMTMINTRVAEKEERRGFVPGTADWYWIQPELVEKKITKDGKQEIVEALGVWNLKTLTRKAVTFDNLIGFFINNATHEYLVTRTDEEVKNILQDNEMIFKFEDYSNKTTDCLVYARAVDPAKPADASRGEVEITMKKSFICKPGKAWQVSKQAPTAEEKAKLEAIIATLNENGTVSAAE